MPLGETAAFRASLQRYQRDGFAEIEGGELDGYDLDDAESTVGKIALLWQPADNFSVLAQAFMHDSDQHAAAQKNVMDPNTDPRELSQDYPGIFALENYSASLIMEWELESGITIKSLTGWQELRKEQTVDGDRLTEELTSISHIGYSFANWDILPFWDNNSDAISQEISISQATDRFSWVIGGYYLDHENFNDFLEATGAAPFSASPASLPREQLTVETLPPVPVRPELHRVPHRHPQGLCRLRPGHFPGKRAVRRHRRPALPGRGPARCRRRLLRHPAGPDHQGLGADLEGGGRHQPDGRQPRSTGSCPPAGRTAVPTAAASCCPCSSSRRR